jgi:phage shock protein A
MADDATKRGDTAKAAEYNQAAEGFANRLLATEKQVEDLKNMHLQTTQAAIQAKSAVSQNSAALQKKLAERQKLLSQLDQAKMQEQMNKAMATLSETVGQDVPTFDEVRTKIEARYAKALGQSELQGDTVESRMLEVEQASLNIEAKSRLSELRGELGLTAGAAGELPGAGLGELSGTEPKAVTAATDPAAAPVSARIPADTESPTPGS